MNHTAFRRMLFVLSLFLWIAARAQSLEIAVELNPVGSFVARSSQLEGHVSSDSKGGFKAQNVKLDLATLNSDIALRDQHMKDDYFEIKKVGFSHATLKSVQAKDGRFQGLLEIRKKPVPIEGRYRVSGKVLTAEFPTTLSAFGIKEANYMGVGVVDDVQVKVTLPLR
jgi:hypothetical protein